MDEIEAGHAVQRVMSTGAIWVDEEATLRSVSAMLADARIGAVIVRRADGSTGVVSERDIVRALADGADPDEVWAADVMSAPLETVEVDARITDAALKMIAADVRHLAVVDREQIVGVVSARDLLAVLTYEVISSS
jgi:CBS domain-containing protein